MSHFLSRLLTSFIVFCVVSATSATNNTHTFTQTNVRGSDLIFMQKYVTAMPGNGSKITFSKSMANLYNLQNRPSHPQNFGNEHHKITILQNMTDESGFRIIQSLTQQWENETWVNVEKCSYTYDNGNLIEELYQQWENETWVNYGKYTFTYDANGNQIESLGQQWENETWNNYEKWTNTYDANENQIESLGQQWENETWVTFGKSTFTYDANQNLIEMSWIWWRNETWINHAKWTHTYNANGNMTESLLQMWENDTWINENKHTYIYDTNQNLIEMLDKQWENDTWINNSKETYGYDTNGNLIEELHQWWENETWVNDEKGTYTYDTNNNLIEELYQRWENETWIIVEKWTNTYEQYVGIDDGSEKVDLTPAKFTLSNYPNPFNSQTIIQFELPQASTVSLNIYNLRGELIKSLSNEQTWAAGYHSLIWDGTDNQNRPVSSGVYLYQIRTDKFNQSKRCLFLK
jgi:hypothetical protein